MKVPEFPESREILLEDKPLFDSIFAARPPELSAYTFTNIFAWRRPHGYGLSRIGESTILCRRKEEAWFCLEPLGTADIRPVIEEAYRRVGGDSLEFERIQAATAEQFTGDPSYEVTHDRDNSDYLYLTSDLIDLPGRKFDGKRNFMKRFKSQADYEYVRLSHLTMDECHRFSDYWCEERECHMIEGLREEYIAVYEMLSNSEALGIVGGALRVEGEVVAFSLGEALNPETFVVHVEKADSKFDGVYQTINHALPMRPRLHIRQPRAGPRHRACARRKSRTRR